MKTIGIVAEYNPFHNGHEYHIRESRNLVGGDSCVVIVMSGDFAQRGEVAVFSKFARAEAACRCGADLVIELPLPWCVAPAECFAAGAVGLLDALEVDVLSFGSETGNLDSLQEISSLLTKPSFTDEVLRELQERPHQGFAAARQRIAENMLGKELPMMQQPNNILAIEYLKAIRIKNSTIRPLAIRRKGAAHDQGGDDVLPSAYEIRERIRGHERYSETVPRNALEIYCRETEQGRIADDPRRQELVILSRLHFLQETAFFDLPDSGNDIGRRLYRAIRENADYQQILDSVTTKRYPRARIRRLYTAAMLGIKREDVFANPPYARILAFSASGRRKLHDLSGRSRIPLLTRPADVKNLSVEAERCFCLGADAHDTQMMMFSGQNVIKPGEDWRKHPVFCE